MKNHHQSPLFWTIEGKSMELNVKANVLFKNNDKTLRLLVHEKLRAVYSKNYKIIVPRVWALR